MSNLPFTISCTASKPFVQTPTLYVANFKRIKAGIRITEENWNLKHEILRAVHLLRFTTLTAAALQYPIFILQCPTDMRFASRIFVLRYIFILVSLLFLLFLFPVPVLYWCRVLKIAYPNPKFFKICSGSAMFPVLSIEL